jgi:hypothetical protein
MFKIPVVLFTFKRKEPLLRIIDRLSIVKPSKLYLISDAGRNEGEHLLVKDVRESIENRIDWDCEIIKNYADTNKGVYKSIGEGAKWVLEKEESAIFLEDDNLPEITFFDFCSEMLEKYKNDDSVMWVVGTNYLGKHLPKDGASYMFTKHMLPCGWASWGNKFSKFYDGELKLLNKKSGKELKEKFINKKLYKQEVTKYFKTKYTLNKSIELASWDAQIGFSIRHNNLYGISPKYNQIENIGIDELSTHGGISIEGNSSQAEMTSRFCGIKTIPLEFPLKHPKSIEVDLEYEKKIAEIVLYPFSERLKISLMAFIKPLIGINKYASFKTILKKINLH